MVDHDDDKKARQGTGPAASEQSKVPAEIRRHPSNQDGHAGMHGHGGQQSGNKGGKDDAHAHAHEREHAHTHAHEHEHGAEQRADPGSRQGEDLSYEVYAEVQQSAQRAGMGQHRHSSRGSEQAGDADADLDNLGNRSNSAGRSRTSKSGE